MMNYTQQGIELAQLSTPALLGVIVIVLAYIVINLYKKINHENQEKVKELILLSKETNKLISEQINTSKASSEILVKFIESHCQKTHEKLLEIEDDIKDMNIKLSHISHIRNNELSKIYKGNNNA
ncbi:hypothetical protein BXA15_06755 [Campylobacter lari]|nr:hypothetical protein [Campylobacter lari]EAJ5697164.1 hypothetical protein [Campylobacter lari]EAJ6150237.1 hypothetical protein [Campylobacter lari]EDP6875146.1 hypothetical protein [Campylobacter lari]EDP6893225.1 hypothetical protein [Campylobacter lari]